MKRLIVCCDGTWNRADQRSPTNESAWAIGQNWSYRLAMCAA